MTSAPAPYQWTMADPAALAFRFAAPDPLPPYTAVNVLPGQAGYFLFNDSPRLCDKAGLYLLTGSMIHTLQQAEAIQRSGGEAVLTYGAQLLLFDMRPKLYPAETIEVATGGSGSVTVNLALAYRTENAEKLYRSGATFQPADSGDELRQDDPLIADAFRRAAMDAAVLLREHAAACDGIQAAEKALTAPKLLMELRARAALTLAPLGLRADAVHVSIARRNCPYCQKVLSLTEVRERFCRAVDDEGNPQEGCGRRLNACPACGTIVGPERASCPTCQQELLFCDTPGCQTYRLPVHGRFCPVCRRACYPLPPREFLTLM